VPGFRGFSDLLAAQDGNALPEGENLIGGLHSHCHWPAFHSAIDLADEADSDGIHIVFGDLNERHFSMVMTLAVKSHRIALEPAKCCLGIKRAIRPAAAAIMTLERDHYFALSMNKTEARTLQKATKQIEEEWMPKVLRQEG
jgi:hypothetical protein